MKLIYRIALAAISFGCSLAANAQIDFSKYASVKGTDSIDWEILHKPLVISADSLLIDREDFDSIISVPQRRYAPFMAGYMRPVVFDAYEFLDPLPLEPSQKREFPETFEYFDDMADNDQLYRIMRQRYMMDHPQSVTLNQLWMPDVPKSFKAYIDPVSSKIKFREMKVNRQELVDDLQADIDRKHWIHSFDASLQFSQAYISPNWYQGGNNNLNMIALIGYHVKLNQKFYPNYLFEASVQYKLGFNNAPDDSIHSINISEDIFQFNLTAGLKAAKRWFYSANIMFKTQLLNSYTPNTYNLNSAFLSPGELNVGLGMTYNYSNKRKTFTLGASISPLSWNMKTCTNHHMDVNDFGIAPGRRLKNKIGSSGEMTMEWRIAYNIVYHSRLFAFTDYDYMYGDWEHTVDFNINRFLTTRLYFHMRYDTTTPRVEDSNWHKFQFKEIFSFGFAYHFGTV